MEYLIFLRSQNLCTYLTEFPLILIPDFDGSTSSLAVSEAGNLIKTSLTLCNLGLWKEQKRMNGREKEKVCSVCIVRQLN